MWAWISVRFLSLVQSPASTTPTCEPWRRFSGSCRWSSSPSPSTSLQSVRLKSSLICVSYSILNSNNTYLLPFLSCRRCSPTGWPLTSSRSVKWLCSDIPLSGGSSISRKRSSTRPPLCRRTMGWSKAWRRVKWKKEDRSCCRSRNQSDKVQTDCLLCLIWCSGWKNAQLAQQLEERERRIKNHLDIAAKGQWDPVQLWRPKNW